MPTPIDIAVAPASINSIASSPDIIPPNPIIGIFTALETSYTILTAIGLMAGPDSPPVTFANTGFLVFISIFIAKNVFINDTASAPPSSAPFAILAISVTLGVSFTISGLSNTFLTSLVTFFTSSYVLPNAMQPSFTFGHDKFSSTPSISNVFNILHNSTYSSTELPHAFTIIFVSNFLKNGKSLLAKNSTPGF